MGIIAIVAATLWTAAVVETIVESVRAFGAGIQIFGRTIITPGIRPSIFVLCGLAASAGIAWAAAIAYARGRRLERRMAADLDERYQEMTTRVAGDIARAELASWRANELGASLEDLVHQRDEILAEMDLARKRTSELERWRTTTGGRSRSCRSVSWSCRTSRTSWRGGASRRPPTPPASAGPAAGPTPAPSPRARRRASRPRRRRCPRPPTPPGPGTTGRRASRRGGSRSSRPRSPWGPGAGARPGRTARSPRNRRTRSSRATAEKVRVIAWAIAAPASRVRPAPPGRPRRRRRSRTPRGRSRGPSPCGRP